MPPLISLKTAVLYTIFAALLAIFNHCSIFHYVHSACYSQTCHTWAY